MSESRKVQIQFDGRALEQLETLKAASHRRTVAEVVRDALAFYDWCRRSIEDGWTIVAIKDVREREPVLPFEGPR